MIDTLQMIFFTLVALGVLVTIHEFGHFWVARRCGVKVVRFSIGFGTPLLRWNDRHGTEFVISLLPLGGYVKMVDEREGPVADSDRPQAFNSKSVWQRMAIVVAGPIANFFLAIVVYWVVFLLGTQGVTPIIGEIIEGSIADEAKLEPGQEIIAVDGELTPTWQALGEQLVRRIGEYETITFTVQYPDSNLQYQSEAELNGWQVDDEDPNPIRDMGIHPYYPEVLPIADKIIPEGAASIAGLRSGDQIIEVDGQALDSWLEWVEYVRDRPDQSIEVIVARDEQTQALKITPKGVAQDSGTSIGQVGMTVKIPEWPEGMVREIHYGPVEAMTAAIAQTWKTTKLMLDSIRKLCTGLISPKHLSGPITIAKVAGASAEYGIGPYLKFLALLSVSLGVLNLLPVPVLDGGHLMYFLIEAVKGSPVSEQIQLIGYKIGLFMVIGLMVLALYNDVMRL